eukprot:m.644277 g.644277  ORF g.644277 m.644277 type:complete len:649 (+) comp22647_c0_seq16:193-2139(+)
MHRTKILGCITIATRTLNSVCPPFVCTPLIDGIKVHLARRMACSDGSSRTPVHGFSMKLKLCVWLQLSVYFLGGSLPLSSAASHAPESGMGTQRNVLFIVVDNLRPALGAYGSDIVVSPNIDEITQNGTIFARAYCQEAWCSPSRNSFLSGRRPRQTQAWNFRDSFRTAYDGTPGPGANWTTLPGYFKQNGYYTTSSGKVFHPQLPANLDFPQSWSDRPVLQEKFSCVTNASSKNRTMACALPDGVLDADIVLLCVPRVCRGCAACVTCHSWVIVHWLCGACSCTPTGLCQSHGPTTDSLVGEHHGATTVLCSSGVSGSAAAMELPCDSPVQVPTRGKHFVGTTPGVPRTKRTGGNRVVSTNRGCILYRCDCQWRHHTCETNGGHSSATCSPCVLRRHYTHRRPSGPLACDAAGPGRGRQHRHCVHRRPRNLGEDNTWSMMSLHETSLRVPLIIRAAPNDARLSRASTVRVYDHMVELIDLFPTMVALAGLPAPPTSWDLPGDNLVPGMQSGGVVKRVDAAFGEITRCRNCSEAYFRENKTYDAGCLADAVDAHNFTVPCALTLREHFDLMGMSVRTHDWRMSMFCAWDGQALSPDFATCRYKELYDHRGDTELYNVDTNGEYTNLAGDANYSWVEDLLLGLLLKQYQ